MIDRKEYWETVYRSKNDREVSWYREHLENSLEFIKGTGAGLDAAVIDVGGGSSTLVDDLVEQGYKDVTVLDVSLEALERSKARLGTEARKVEWKVADITTADLAADRYDVWHDRAVFHFLTNESDRKKYVELVRHAVKPGGHIIVASFGPKGPIKCSGLDVVRYSPAALHNEFGPEFKLMKDLSEEHNTPSGSVQEFVYCYCRKVE